MNSVTFPEVSSETGSFNPEIYRSHFPHINDGGIYLNHAALSPLPLAVTEAVTASLKRRQQGAIDHFETEFPIIENTRYLLSQLIGADGGHQLAFTPNTSFAISIIAQGIDWEPGDEVLLYEREFPSNVYPWLQLKPKGVEVAYLSDDRGKISVPHVKSALKRNTKVLSISAVQFLSGYRADLAEISSLCKANGTKLVVDAIQALGHSPVNVSKLGIDALCCGGHKWLMSPQGIGFMYMSDEFRDQISITAKGWLSVENVWDLFDTNQSLHPNMNRFEPGTYNIPAITGMHEALTIILEAGVENIRRHVLELTDFIISELIRAGLMLYGTHEDENRSAIVSFILPPHINSEDLVRQLGNKKVYVSARSGLLRISPYFYTTRKETERAVTIIKRLIQ